MPRLTTTIPTTNVSELLLKYGISRQTLSKVWKRGQETRSQDDRADVALKRKSRSGRRPKRTTDEVEAAVKSIPPHLRITFASLAASSGIPPSTLWRVLQTRKLQRRTSQLEPMMTDKHKADRVDFVRSFVRSTGNGPMRWDDMHDSVHIDEKWFYLMLVNRRYYLWHDEAVPIRKFSSKRHIIKVVFLTAVARPRYNYNSRTMWDGKIGIWPFVSVVPAQRKNKNRDRGTSVTTPVTVTKPVYREYLLKHVIPTIKEVWPGRRSEPIYIQQDNARPHVEVDDADVTMAGCSDGGAHCRHSRQ
ncbi:hypothetical protein H257_07582 [Aphanomyces astaci]|uniref:Transposase Tc1-like domain-containing protein n=1 Tax=Aphanomyces astaci TaxID=112090 RepID=W4GI78_APHAT|nr:hypothetical protein H257_07582 [Aphanomyces astaci]ETV78739.1 hypothetical protein H257_07582 [Aphanomyces astaci]|eukprot:XP_009831458.1 hypothetical protein H257_07582 [Aphanomyces astaci]